MKMAAEPIMGTEQQNLTIIGRHMSTAPGRIMGKPSVKALRKRFSGRVMPAIRELSNVARVTPPGAEPYSTEGHNRQSTHADTPPCGISSCSKRPIWHSIRSCPNSRVVPGTSVLANLNARCPGVSNEVSSDWSPVGASELPTCGLRSI